MSVELEDRVRAALNDKAVEIEVRGIDPEGVFARVRERRARRRTARAVVATLAVALLGAGVIARHSATSVTAGHAASPPAVPLTDPAMITLDAPGWSVNYIGTVNKDYTEYQFTDGTRTLQVGFYPLASREGNSTNPTEVTVRGAHGVTTDEGAPRYRVDWNEQGHTWEADGEPYTDVNEFLALLDHVRILDQASWEATLPNGVAATILANTDKGVSWYPDKGVACFGPQQSMPCN